MADVAFMPEGHVLQTDERVPAQNPRETAQPFAGDRIPLVRHRGTSLLPLTKKFFYFQNFGALQVPEFRCPPVDARRDQRHGSPEFSVAVPLNDLRGNFRRVQAESLANLLLDRRIEMRMSSDSPAEFTDPNALSCLREPFFRPPKFIEHQRQLQPERDRLRVNSMTPTDHRRYFVTACLGSDHLPQRRQILRQDSACFRQLDGERRVENV